MSYASLSDLGARLDRRLIAELSGSEDGAPVTGRVEQALEDASAEVDSYLGERFVTPLVSPPPMILRVTCDIAIYRLFQAARDGDVKDSRRRYEDAVAWLKSIAEGAVTFDARERRATGDRLKDSAATVKVPPVFAGGWGDF